MDGVTLVLDAATSDGSVAVVRDGALVAERTVAMRGITEERLMPAVAAALAEAGVRAGAMGALRRVVCGAGPGSFTSLRIAAGIAKGISAGSDVPLYAVSSLALAVPSLAAGRYVIALDALRGESYAAVFAWDGRRVHELARSTIVATGELASLAAAHAATLAEAVPHARGAVPMLGELVARGAVDRGTWEPAYGRLAEAQVKWEAAHGRPLDG